MRRFDKTKNILKANLLAEQRYLESKGLIKEGIDDNPVDSRRQEYDDYEAGQQDYEERQKLKNMPNDNIIYNIVQNGKNEYYSFNSNDTGTAKIEVLGDNDGEVIATYYFELADLKDLDNRPWVGLANASLGDNANISKEADEYITDMIENSDKLVQSHNQYVNDNHEEPENDFYDRHERLDEATTSWKKLMAAVRRGVLPYSLVVVDKDLRKVVKQKINIKNSQKIPADYESLRKEFPNALIHLEDSEGSRLWSN